MYGSTSVHRATGLGGVELLEQAPVDVVLDLLAVLAPDVQLMLVCAFMFKVGMTIGRDRR